VARLRSPDHCATYHAAPAQISIQVLLRHARALAAAAEYDRAARSLDAAMTYGAAEADVRERRAELGERRRRAELMELVDASLTARAVGWESKARDASEELLARWPAMPTAVWAAARVAQADGGGPRRLLRLARLTVDACERCAGSEEASAVAELTARALELQADAMHRLMERGRAPDGSGEAGRASGTADADGGADGGVDDQEGEAFEPSAVVQAYERALAAGARVQRKLQALQAERASTTDSEQMLAKAEELKRAGNALYAQRRFSDALSAYADALQQCAHDVRFAELLVSLHSNRAAAFLEMGGCEASVRECQEAIRSVFCLRAMCALVRQPAAIGK
jgi:tetratricopeptide (TPR) repeat protein